MLHAVFRVDWSPGESLPEPRSPEVDAAEFWPISPLPRPLSTFTAERMHDARSGQAVARIVRGREWLADDPG